MLTNSGDDTGFVVEIHCPSVWGLGFRFRPRVRCMVEG